VTVPAAGQDTTRTRRDTVRVRDTTFVDSVRARIDSIEAEDRRIIERQRRLADTVKAPLAVAEAPLLTDIGAAQAWDRSALFATGALTLGELVERVPGVTGYRTSWIASPHLSAYLGQFGRVRVFLDGVELDALDARSGGLHDFSFIDTWHLEDARIEQGAGEVRVHLRSWRVRSTTPATRVDVHTGDLETNTYRAYYGRRMPRGEVLQLGAYQFSTTDIRFGGDADQTSLWGRLGWANRHWTVDASALQVSRDRAPQLREPPRDDLPKLDATSSIAYARVAYGSPDAGPWLQALASTQSFVIQSPTLIIVDSIPGPGGGGPHGSPEEPDTIRQNTDSLRSHPQYVLSGGLTRGNVRLSATARLRRVDGRSVMTPGVRASYESGRVALSGFAERSMYDSLLRTEVAGRVQPTGFLALGGAVSRFAPLADGGPQSTAARGEVGLRLGRLWITGGLMTRTGATLPAPVVFDTGFRAATDGRTTAHFATIRGKFFRDLGLDVVGVRYPDNGVFRPQYHVRSRFYLDTDMRGRFPSGNLNILLAFTHEYRSEALFPTDDGVLESSHYRVWGAHLEIRLLSATLSYQYRNFLDADYAQVPGFLMPRPINFYGVRWDFFN
jgi:hypothetical protein